MPRSPRHALKRSAVARAALAAAAILFLPVCLTVLTLCLVTACHRPKIPLAGGFYLFRDNLSSECVCHPNGGVLMEARIAMIGECEGFIVGQVAPPIDGFERYKPFPIGFFTIRKTTKQITSGLTAAELEALLGGPAPAMYDPKFLALWRWWDPGE